MQEREFFCDKEVFGKAPLKIYVKEFLNEEPGKRQLPAIIFSHGFGGDSVGMEHYGRYFAGKGYAAYCLDFCGGSLPGIGKSDGNSLDMTIPSECDDLITVLHAVKELPYIDAGNISLMGCSQGGFVSGLVAAKCGAEVSNLVMVFPALCIPDHARMGALGGASYDTKDVPEKIVCPGGMHISRRYHEAVADMDPYLEISRYKGRVFVIHGKKDDVVPYVYGVKAQQCYEEGQCRLMSVEDAGHGFNQQQDESVMIAVEHFLNHQEELLTIQVIVTGYKVLKEEENYREAAVYFTGYCHQDNFKGCIIPEGVDVQKQYGDAPAILRAEYTLVGTDQSGQKCSVHIINQKKGEYYKPELTTDSKELAFLMEKDLTATLEGFPGGLTVRIFG